ncbi:expressed unknown protein [Seminavis robusta]|uniref:Hydroxyproline O-arabinosyltransferase-like domain-containing protein n=1 Tax=Seminavis robusta TaxID=568900 RepID=A0A9N8DYE0_9STRA|nr:expressed unknown protein [Seminavis robusta]|eukprot:Sro341_g121390.1 n/a (586) ;mRNA; r:16543-18388
MKSLWKRVLPLDRRRGFHQQKDGFSGRSKMRYFWLVLVCTIASHFILTTLYVPAQTLGLLESMISTATEEENRVERKKFELFSLSNFDAEQERETHEQVHHEKNRKKFELFALGGSKDSVIKSKKESSREKATSKESLQSTQLYTYNVPSCQESANTSTTVAESEPIIFEPSIVPKSVLIRGGGLLQIKVGQYRFHLGSVMESEGCVDLYESILANQAPVQFTLLPDKHPRVLSRSKQIPDTLQQQFSTATDLSQPHTKIVFSATSSDYFGYQVYAHALGFLQSNQTNASWMRLLTARIPDDLSERFPTFTAPQSIYSREYAPINKADVIDKWMHSADAPHPDDTIVVIDPDNWLLKDVHKWTRDVSSKQAVGQVAYYGWDDKIKTIWKSICKENCEQKLDPVGVPYFVKASDLKEIAPLWRTYSIAIRQNMRFDEEWKKNYASLGIEWAAEMVGFNAACAHLQIKTKVVDNLQVRDTSTTRNWPRWSNVPMIHMGRAWFPDTEKELAAPWVNEDDGGFSHKGIQVWCKCNATAAKVQPWPMPEQEMDFVSYHTLRLLHDSIEHFGPVPVNETYRLEGNPYLTPI